MERRWSGPHTSTSSSEPSSQPRKESSFPVWRLGDESQASAAADMAFCCGLCERNKEVASWHLGLRRYPIGNYRKANSVGFHGPGQTCVLVTVLSCPENDAGLALCFSATKDPTAVERANLLNMAKLSIKGLIESALSFGRTLDSDYPPLQQFFVVMEHCLKHGLKGIARLRKSLLRKSLLRTAPLSAP